MLKPMLRNRKKVQPLLKPGVTPARQEEILTGYIDWLDVVAEELAVKFGELETHSQASRFLKRERDSALHRLAQLKASLKEPPNVF